MPKVHYSLGYIDLTKGKDELFSRIRCRTEIRKAQKEGVRVTKIEGERKNELKEKCVAMLKSLLAKEFVSYSKSFDILISDTNNYLFIAQVNGEIVSFIVVQPKANNPFDSKSKTAYLALSATDDRFKGLCPNYLLIWEACLYLMNRGYDYFNLGLLNYHEVSDKMLEKVAFFKRKWDVKEKTESEKISLARYIYYRFFKNTLLVKKIVYRFNKYFNK